MAPTQPRRSERIAKAAQRPGKYKGKKPSQNAKITKKPKAKPYRRPRQSPESLLLSLPGELRNQIYRYAVVRPGDTQVFARSHKAPSLLNTCTAIRKEAGSIYYIENVFDLIMWHYKGADFASFYRAYDSFTKLGGSNVGYTFMSEPDWDNLVEWIKLVHEQDTANKLPKMDPDPDADDEIDGWVVAGVIDMYDALRHEPWRTVEAALKAFYRVLRGTESDWVKPEDRIL